MLGPRNRPTSHQAFPPSSRPATGSTRRVYNRHARRQTGLGGTKKSRPAMAPPGRRARASSAMVAAGSATYRRTYVKLTASNAPAQNGRSSVDVLEHGCAAIAETDMLELQQLPRGRRVCLQLE